MLSIVTKGARAISRKSALLSEAEALLQKRGFRASARRQSDEEDTGSNEDEYKTDKDHASYKLNRAWYAAVVAFPLIAYGVTAASTDDEKYASIIAKANSPSAVVRMEAYQQLLILSCRPYARSKFNEPRILDVLVRAARSEQDAGARATALTALAKISKTEAFARMLVENAGVLDIISSQLSSVKSNNAEAYAAAQFLSSLSYHESIQSAIAQKGLISSISSIISNGALLPEFREEAIAAAARLSTNPAIRAQVIASGALANAQNVKASELSAQGNAYIESLKSNLSPESATKAYSDLRDETDKALKSVALTCEAWKASREAALAAAWVAARWALYLRTPSFTGGAMVTKVATKAIIGGAGIFAASFAQRYFTYNSSNAYPRQASPNSGEDSQTFIMTSVMAPLIVLLTAKFARFVVLPIAAIPLFIVSDITSKAQKRNELSLPELSSVSQLPATLTAGQAIAEMQKHVEATKASSA